MYGINKDLHLHFIGIGGIGMSGIAKVLMNLGYSISGSDLGENETTDKLKKAGAKIYKGHAAENIKQVQIVVYSSAINENNPEIIEAKKQKIPMIRRAEMLAELMRLKYGMAVAGSHGKTTTTSFLSTIMNGLNHNPTYIIGGLVKNLQDNAAIGDSDLLIAEADESDGSFLYLNPIMSIITNIDNDHLDYHKTLDNLKNAFSEFSNKVPFYGVVALNANDKPSVELLKKLKRPHIFFAVEGLELYSNQVDIFATNVEETVDGAKFNVVVEEEVVPFEISLNGLHNISNALGAISLARAYGGKLVDIAKAIKTFEGVSRRQEVIYSSDSLVVIDDYAHHPTEIKATISTVKNKFPNKKLVVCFEPHRFSRTKNFWEEFIVSFEGAEELYISPIYAASEQPIPYIDSEVLVKNINSTGILCRYLDNTEKISSVIDAHSSSQSVVLTLGAGAISKIAKKIINEKFNQ
jgi:UDP-N-acetylmuramate--alanine ligase